MDAVLVAAFDRVGGWLQERCGFSLPAILREATTAVGVAMALAALAQFAALGPTPGTVALSALAAALGWFMSHRWRSLDRDAKRDWTPELAREYLAQAETRRSRDALVRIAMTVFAASNAVQFSWLLAGDGVPGSVAAILPFQVAAVCDLYLSCAHPRDPGSGIREAPRPAWGV